MKEILNDKYARVSFDEYKRILMSEWKEASSEISIDELKFKIQNAAHLIESFKPLYFLSNNLNQKFVFNVEIQDWIAKTMATPCVKVGVKKFAIILPQDLLPQLSTEQTAEETQLPIDIKFFLSIEDAFRWFELE